MTNAQQLLYERGVLYDKSWFEKREMSFSKHLALIGG